MAKDVKVKLSADTKEAVRSVRDFERQVNKLGDLSDQGQRRQNGFLSSRQVQMYKRILREMEQTYQQHRRNLDNMEKTYESKKNSKEQQKMRDLEKDLRKREQLLRHSEGGNRWGETSSPLVQEHHRKKLEEAKTAYDSYKSSDEFKNSTSEATKLKAELNTMRAAVNRMETERNRSNIHSNSINNMHEQEPYTRRHVTGMAHTVAASVGVLGFSSYWRYSMSGIDKLRHQERLANRVALTQGTYEGDGVDRAQRERMQSTGIKANYDIAETAMLQRTIISGGKEKAKNLDKDTESIQKMSRGYNLDANEVAEGGALLRKMGTFTQGEQDRFANIIAGQIAKNGMGGRQEEMMRATISLAQSVSQGQASFSQDQFKSVAGLQTALGDAVPTLKGERGANLLSNIDSGIKNGGNQLDLLMGKGTEFTGLSGMYDLELLKEQGISNPENLQRVLKGARRMFGGNEKMTGYALKEQLGVKLNEYEAMKKSGLLDRIMEDPQSVTQQDLEKAGATDVAKQWNTYQGSETAKVDSLNAHTENRQADHAKAVDAVSKTSRGWFNDLPEPMQHLMLGAGGAMGGTMLYKGLSKGVPWLYNKMTRTMNPNIGGQGGLRGALSNAGNEVRGLFRPGGMSRAGTLLKGAGRIAGPAGELMAFDSIDKMNGNLWDWLLGHKKGMAKPKTGIFHNPFGSQTDGTYDDDRQGALSKLWDSLTGGSKKDSGAPVPKDRSVKGDGKIGSINVENLKVNDKKLGEYFSANTNTKNSEKGKEQLFRIIIEGDVKGMNDKNQKEVKDSVKDFFASGLGSPLFKYNLSLDQSRG